MCCSEFLQVQKRMNKADRVIYPIIKLKTLKVLFWFCSGHDPLVLLELPADGNKYKGNIYMVFEYMDHDLTGLSDRPGMRFTIPQIKVTLLYLLVSSKLNPQMLFILFFYNSLIFTVLHEATSNRSSLLPCQPSASSWYQRFDIMLISLVSLFLPLFLFLCL